MTTGGQEECWWQDCYEYIDFILPPTCLSDCYPADHCLSSLLADYQAAGGVCPGSYLDVVYPGLFQVSDQLGGYDQYGVWRGCEIDNIFVMRGLCSETTKELLRDQENCVIPIFSQKLSILRTTRELIRSMCDEQAYDDFWPAPLDRRSEEKITRQQRSPPEHLTSEDDREVRLIPIVGSTSTGVPPLENTKHRYPWLCSLRSVGQQNSHICGVTLLSRPPGPTVLVTSAHCAYICKSEEGRVVPNCCCPNVGGPGLCTEGCGTNSTTVLMTGAEAEVKCGEWDTATDTEEDYYVILPIEKITVHPDFNISRGEQNSQFVASDIATIHVSDENFEAQSTTHRIYPACLPTKPLSDKELYAVHSGWSKPPPLDYVTANAAHHLDYYSYFSKQWHYSVNLTKCEDPRTIPITLYPYTGEPLNYPTNSYYPPGTVCAVEQEGKFCPTSGESGSPLMVTDDEGRMVAEGIHSFIKVLTIFVLYMPFFLPNIASWWAEKQLYLMIKSNFKTFPPSGLFPL